MADKRLSMFVSMLVVLLLPSEGQGEIYTSMASMEVMLLYEGALLNILKNETVGNKWNNLKPYLKLIDEAQQFIVDNGVHDYLKNPVNIYKMIRRMNLQWNGISEIINSSNTDHHLISIIDGVSLPNAEDRIGAVNALFRLQHTYNLSSNLLAKGIIPGVDGLISQPLDIEEMYEIGMKANEDRSYYHARNWMRAILDLMGDAGTIGNVKRSDVLDHLAFCEYKHGNMTEAIRLAEELPKLVPADDDLALEMVEFYKNESTKQTDSTSHDNNVSKSNVLESAFDDAAYVGAFELLCRGEFTKEMTSVDYLMMTCWYKSDDPVLLLKPQKIERLSVDPEIYRYIDILTEQLADTIKFVTYDRLERSKVTSGDEGGTITTDRIGKSSGIDDLTETFLVPAKIRAQAVTGLDMEYKENLAVTNYGIGGHYNPHYDYGNDVFGRDKMLDELGMGNRIATLMFYVSDVEAGGATVFVGGRIAAFPKKRDAIFWYNLKRNGNGNALTLHGGCPVLVGQKWIANWWIHSYGQEFRRKCGLNEDL